MDRRLLRPLIMRIPSSAVVVAVVALVVSGCVLSEPETCTTDFRAVSVVVTSSGGQPVEGLVPEITFDRTGDPVPNAGLDDPFVEGYYTVVDDSLSRELEGRIEQITFRVSAPLGSATGRFAISADSCHIRKLSGPDTLVLD